MNTVTKFMALGSIVFSYALNGASCAPAIATERKFLSSLAPKMHRFFSVDRAFQSLSEFGRSMFNPGYSIVQGGEEASRVLMKHAEAGNARAAQAQYEASAYVRSSLAASGYAGGDDGRALVEFVKKNIDLVASESRACAVPSTSVEKKEGHASGYGMQPAPEVLRVDISKAFDGVKRVIGSCARPTAEDIRAEIIKALHVVIKLQTNRSKQSKQEIIDACSALFNGEHAQFIFNKDCDRGNLDNTELLFMGTVLGYCTDAIQDSEVDIFSVELGGTFSAQERVSSFLAGTLTAMMEDGVWSGVTPDAIRSIIDEKQADKSSFLAVVCDSFDQGYAKNFVFFQNVHQTLASWVIQTIAKMDAIPDTRVVAEVPLQELYELAIKAIQSGDAECAGLERLRKEMGQARWEMMLDMACSDTGCTLLHRAALEDSPAPLRFLLQNGAKRIGLCRNNMDEMPLGVAVRFGRELNVQSLLTCGEDVGVTGKNTMGESLLHLVVSFGGTAPRKSSAIANLLLSHGASESIASRNNQLRTPLHCALERGCVALSLIQLLLDHGAQAVIHEQDCDGNTAAHYASAKSSLEVIEFLLQHGATESLLTQNKAGMTPLAYCKHLSRSSRAEQKKIEDLLAAATKKVAKKHAEDIQQKKAAARQAKAKAAHEQEIKRLAEEKSKRAEQEEIEKRNAEAKALQLKLKEEEEARQKAQKDAERRSKINARRAENREKKRQAELFAVQAAEAETLHRLEQEKKTKADEAARAEHEAEQQEQERLKKIADEIAAEAARAQQEAAEEKIKMAAAHEAKVAQELAATRRAERAALLDARSEKASATFKRKEAARKKEAYEQEAQQKADRQAADKKEAADKAGREKEALRDVRSERAQARKDDKIRAQEKKERLKKRADDAAQEAARVAKDAADAALREASAKAESQEQKNKAAQENARRDREVKGKQEAAAVIEERVVEAEQVAQPAQAVAAFTQAVREALIKALFDSASLTQETLDACRRERIPLNCVDEHGNTPLAVAALSGDTHAIGLLAKAGANLSGVMKALTQLSPKAVAEKIRLREQQAEGEKGNRAVSGVTSPSEREGRLLRITEHLSSKSLQKLAPKVATTATSGTPKNSYVQEIHDTYAMLERVGAIDSSPRSPFPAVTFPPGAWSPHEAERHLEHGRRVHAFFMQQEQDEAQRKALYDPAIAHHSEEMKKVTAARASQAVAAKRIARVSLVEQINSLKKSIELECAANSSAPIRTALQLQVAKLLFRAIERDNHKAVLACFAIPNIDSKRLRDPHTGNTAIMAAAATANLSLFSMILKDYHASETSRKSFSAHVHALNYAKESLSTLAAGCYLEASRNNEPEKARTIAIMMKELVRKEIDFSRPDGNYMTALSLLKIKTKKRQGLNDFLQKIITP